ncbi:UNVERIFIED_CONTAM: hypothetical protein GTU68_021650, partial [Idotea baltica]|nr:hypothetical protein [Idotea baltica]
PDGIYENVFATSKQIEKITSDRRVKGLTLTGSVGTGRILAELAGRNLKKSVMELGGSDPAIVLDDADLELASKSIARARCFNTGQYCIAAKRVFVADRIYDDFMSLFLDEMKSYECGDPLELGTKMGPLARKDLRVNLDRQVKDSISKGASLTLGGEIPEGIGYFYPATILENINLDSPAFNQELFGPVAAVIKYKDDQEAISLANNSDYGLGASIYSADKERALNLSTQIEAGNVYINQPVTSTPELPCGGIKNSGYGREYGEEGIKEFVNIKTVWMK